MTKRPLGSIRPCGAPACDISTNKRYVHKGELLVACCPKHAEKAYGLLARSEQLVAVAA